MLITIVNEISRRKSKYTFISLVIYHALIIPRFYKTCPLFPFYGDFLVAVFELGTALDKIT